MLEVGGETRAEVGRGGRFAADFLTAFAVLLVVKLGLVAGNVTAPGGASAQRDLVKSILLLLGDDAVGAGGVATLLHGIRSSLGARGSGRWLGVGLHAGHALFATASAWTLAFLGGWIGRAALSAMIQQSEDGSRALLGSSSEFMTFRVVASVVLVPLLAAGLSGGLTKRAGRFRRPALYVMGAAALGLVLATRVLLPRAEARAFGRVFPNGLDKSPVVEFVMSFVRPLLRSANVRTGSAAVVPLVSISGGGRLEGPFIEARPERTDVVVVLLESVGADYVEKAPTPMPTLAELDRDARAIRLTSHYTTWSLTTKALFSLLTSELPYPDTEPESFVNPGIRTATLSRSLHDAGYFTAFFSSQDFTWEREIAFLRNRGFDVMHDMRSLPGREGAWSSPWGIDDRVTVKALLAAMNEHRGRPFFGLLQLVSGHHPYIALEEHEKTLETAPRDERYIKAIGVADDRLRDLVAGLRARGTWDRTLLVVVSDHGEAHAIGQGRNLFQSVVRVPALVLGPQTKGGTVSAVTSHIDLAPTVLGLLGLPVPCSMKGRDLTRKAPEHLALFGGRPPDFQFGAVDRSFKYVLEGDGTERLYDLSLDPTGAIDCAPGHAGVVRALAERVLAWREGSRWLVPEYEAHLTASGCAGTSPASR